MKQPAALLDAILGFLFQPLSEIKRRWLVYAWAGGLFLVGVFLLGQLLNWGRGPLEFHDWAEVNAPRLAFLRDAVATGQLPLHMPDSSALRSVTDRYMALPDVILAPQALLLPLFSVAGWVLFNTLLLYALGCGALAWLWRRFDLSPLVFAVLFVIYSANGSIQAHLSVGHVNFASYFLFPWLIVLLIQVLDAERLPGWGWVAKTAFLLFFILLNGGFHQFVWGLFFLGFFGLFSWKHFPLAFKTLLASCLLAMVRLLPPALQLSSFDTEYLGGYPSLIELFDGLVRLVDPYQSFDSRSFLTQLGWWEFDLFVGVSGALFLLIFGVARWLRHLDQPDGFPQLVLPSLALLLLAVGRVYRPFMLLPIPLINGERVSARMVILPFLVLAVMAAVQMQRWLDQRAERPLRVELRWGVAALALLLLHDAWQHTRAWRVNNAFFAYGAVDLDLSIKVVANHPDAPYTTLLAIGAVVTLLTALGLVGLAWREKRVDRTTA